MILAAIETAAEAHGLIVMGISPSDEGACILLGAGSDLWPIFQASDEALDGLADPLDRWSKRVIGDLAKTHSGVAKFPSDGPPYLPFIQWAKNSGRFWQSPTGMLIHDEAGLMISIRGAIFLPGVSVTAPTGPSPCESCTEKPCLTACPVSALSGSAPYDVPACKSHIRSDAGAACMSDGCLTRRACPVSQSFGRDPAQSSFHMRAFVGA